MKNKRLLLIPLCLLCTSCSVYMPWQDIESATNDSEATNKESVQLLMDPKFENGFLAIHGAGKKIDENDYIPEGYYDGNVTLKYGDNKKSPTWTLRQNNDVYNLNDVYHDDVKPEMIDDYYVFTDNSKKLAVNPVKGNLYMELNASQEYPRDRIEEGEWCHMLIASSLSKNTTVSETSSIQLTMDIQLLKNEDRHLLVYHENPVGQFLMYIQMTSTSPNETSNKTFWFGIPLFDTQYPYAGQMVESAQEDFASGSNTGGLIYKIAGKDIYGDENITLTDMKKHSINIDLKPYFERAIELAHKTKMTSGNYFWSDTEFEDLVITDMNLGYELPGRRDMGIEISNFSMLANYN